MMLYCLASGHICTSRWPLSRLRRRSSCTSPSSCPTSATLTRIGWSTVPMSYTVLLDLALSLPSRKLALCAKIPFMHYLGFLLFLCLQVSVRTVACVGPSHARGTARPLLRVPDGLTLLARLLTHHSLCITVSCTCTANEITNVLYARCLRTRLSKRPSSSRMVSLWVLGALFGGVLPVLLAAAMCSFCKSKPRNAPYSSSAHEAGLSQPLTQHSHSVRGPQSRYATAEPSIA